MGWNPIYALEITRLAVVEINESDRRLEAGERRAGTIVEVNLRTEPRPRERVPCARVRMAHDRPEPARVHRVKGARRAEAAAKKREESRGATAKVTALDDGKGLWQ